MFLIYKTNLLASLAMRFVDGLSVAEQAAVLHAGYSPATNQFRKCLGVIPWYSRNLCIK